MGLDMYAYEVAKNAANTDLSTPEGAAKSVLAYWRKFNALHGWMEELFRSLGGEGSFNCAVVRLTSERLDALEHALNTNSLKPQEGFFFGAQEIFPEDIESTREFIKKARYVIECGNEVYYDSWW